MGEILRNGELGEPYKVAAVAKAGRGEKTLAHEGIWQNLLEGAGDYPV